MAEETVFPEHFKERLKSEYEKSRSLYEKLVDEVVYVLRESTERSEVKIHSIASRETKIKTFESFYGKVVQRKILQDQLEEIDDIAAVRVICLYRSDLDKLHTLICQKFEIIEADTSRTRTETPFGYSSDHYTVRLSKQCRGPRYDNIKRLKCEIQVRTLLMDAWASVSHHLEYKQKTDVPRDLKVDFNALAGLFYVADTHFEMFKKGVVEARTSLMKAVQTGEFDLDQDINYESLPAYLQWKFPERKIKPETLLDYGWSKIVKELADFSYVRLRALDDKINIVLPYLKDLERQVFSEEKWRPRWAPDGLIRMVLDLTDDSYVKRHGDFVNIAPPLEKAKDGYQRALAVLKEYRSRLK
jgi:ppGpp synthetase/RelA/SpoT-type nucleotidyltranferase